MPLIDQMNSYVHWYRVNVVSLIDQMNSYVHWYRVNVVSLIDQMNSYVHWYRVNVVSLIDQMNSMFTTLVQGECSAVRRSRVQMHYCAVRDGMKSSGAWSTIHSF